MVKKILTAPDAKLNKVSKEITTLDKKAKNLFKDLKDTLLVQEDPEGVGLAAPQIGVLLRVFVLKDEGGNINFFVNPTILRASKETNFNKIPPEELTKEGCLSVPDVYAYVERPWEIEVSYQDETLSSFKKTLSGIEAEVFQHELDHLDGILFTQRVLEQDANAFSH